MREYTVVGDRLRFPTRDVDLAGPAHGIYEDESLVLVVEEEMAGENVVALEPDGTWRWRITDPEWPDDERGYFFDAWRDGDAVWARSYDGYKYRVDADTGRPLRQLPRKAVPVGGTTVAADRPVERFFRRGETTVALLDRTAAGDGRDRSNVLAVGPDGTERWRLDGVTVPAGAIRRPFESSDPGGLELDARYDGLRRASGTLVAEHRSGVEAAVDPGDGSVTPRGPPALAGYPLDAAALGDTLVLGPETVVRLPSDSTASVEAVDDTVVVTFDTEFADPAWRRRNVVAFDPDGELRWRVDAPTSDASAAFEGVWHLGDRVLVNAADGRTHELDPGTGALGREYAPTELPVGDELLAFPIPVGFATEREGVVVVFLDVLDADVDPDDSPVPEHRCVFGYDTDGNRLWQVESLGEDDAFTDVSSHGRSISAHSWRGKHVHLDWETGETRPETRILS